MAIQSKKFIEHKNLSKGLYTKREAENIPEGAAAGIVNIDIDGYGFGPRKGSSAIGDEPLTGYGLNLYTYKRGEGTEIMVCAFEDTTNDEVKIYWYDDTNKTWELLLSGLQDEQEVSFAPYNDTGLDALYFCNGYNEIYKWNGATGRLNGALSGGEATITVDSTDGFDLSGTIIIGGTNVTYTGSTATTFTGCNSTPAASDNEGIAQLPDSIGEQLDAMDATAGWGSINGGDNTDVTIAQDTGDKQEGTASIKFTVSAAGDTEVKKSHSNGKLPENAIIFWIKSSVAGDKLSFKLYELSRYATYNFTTSITADTWTNITIVPYGYDDASSTLPDFNSIDAIGFINMTHSAVYHVDDIRLSPIPARILLEHNAKLWKADHPAAPTLLEYSVTGDPENFYTVTGATAAGSEDFPEGGGKITALVPYDDDLIVFKKDLVKRYRLNYIDDGSGLVSQLNPIRQGLNIGALNNKGAINGDLGVYYISPKEGLRQLERNDLKQLTDNIRPTLADYDFSDAVAVFWENKVLVACKESGITFNNVVMVYDLTEPGITWYRGWNVADWTIFDDELYFISSIEPQMYKAFDGYSEGASSAIYASWTSKIEDWGNRFKKKQFDVLGVVGKISENSEITVTVQYDENGSLSTLEGTISGSSSNDYIFLPGGGAIGGPLGQNVFGKGIFGGNESSGDSDLNRFRVFFKLPFTLSPYNVQVQFSSNAAGQRWKILGYAFNPMVQENIPKNLLLALS